MRPDLRVCRKWSPVGHKGPVPNSIETIAEIMCEVHLSRPLFCFRISSWPLLSREPTPFTARNFLPNFVVTPEEVHNERREHLRCEVAGTVLLPDFKCLALEEAVFAVENILYP